MLNESSAPQGRRWQPWTDHAHMDAELERLRLDASCACECDTCHQQDEIVPGARCGFCGLGVMHPMKVRRGR